MDREDGKPNIKCEDVGLPHGFHATVTPNGVVMRCIYCGRERRATDPQPTR